MRRAVREARMGVDVGTTAVRVAAYADIDGELLASAERPIALHVRGPKRELDVEAAWRQLTDALAEVDRSLCVMQERTSVSTIAVASTASTILATDTHLEPIGRALMWSDHRAIAEADEIRATGHPRLEPMLGHVSPEWGLPKLVHLARRWTVAGRREGHILELIDWLNWRLSGSLVGNAGIREWGWCATADGALDPTLVALLGMPNAGDLVASRVLMTGSPIGPLRSELAERFGSLRGATVLMGGMDSYLAAFGQGVGRSGRLAVSFGSSSSFLAGTDSGDAQGRMFGPLRNILPGPRAYWHGGQTTAGLAVDWFLRIFRQERESLELAAARVLPGSDGAVFRETLLDRRVPRPAAPLRGAWAGIGLAHTPAHLYRSILEGICLGVRYASDGLAPRDVIVGGGLAESNLMLAILADVLGRPVSRVRHAQPAAFGVAFAGAGERIPELNSVVQTIEPSGADYDRIFARYCGLHEGGLAAAGR